MTDKYKFVIEGTDKTRKMFKSLRGGLGKVRGAINSTQVKVAGLAGVAGLGALVKSSLATNDALAKTADRLGLTTRQLSAYQHQANLTGSDNAKLNKSLELMNRNLGDAERGTGEAVYAMEDLGLSATKLNQMPTAERFELLVEKIGAVSDRTKQASLAADIFGRSGTDLINLIDQGAAGLDAAKREVDAYGVALSRVDAAKMEAANDAMFRAQQVGRGVANQLTIKLAPIIEEIAVQFADAAKEGGGMGTMVESAFKKGVSIAGVFADGIHGLKVIFQGVKTLAWGLGAAVVGSAKLAVEGLIGLGNTIKNAVLAPLKLVLKGASYLPGIGDKAAAALAAVNAQFADIKPPESLQGAFDFMVNGLRNAKTELHSMLMEDLPSHVMADRVKGILDAADARAQQIAAKAQGKAGLSGVSANDEGQSGGAVGVDGLTDAEREQMAAKLETLKLSWFTELEQLQVKQDQEMAILDQAYANKLIAHDEYERSLTQLEGKHAKEREKLEKASSKNRWQAFAGAMDMMLGASDSGSKKLFKIQKALSLAKAVATLPSAVIESYNNSGGYPWGIPAALAMAATGLAQIAKIKSANFSGGGAAGGSVSAGGGSSVASAPPSQGANLAGVNQFANNDAQQPAAQVSITIAGNVYGDNGATVVEQIRTLMSEQDVVLFDSNSRQAQELTG